VIGIFLLVVGAELRLEEYLAMENAANVKERVPISNPVAVGQTSVSENPSSPSQLDVPIPVHSATPSSQFASSTSSSSSPFAQATDGVTTLPVTINVNENTTLGEPSFLQWTVTDTSQTAGGFQELVVFKTMNMSETPDISLLSTTSFDDVHLHTSEDVEVESVTSMYKRQDTTLQDLVSVYSISYKCD
jgi:hypothetical protein